MSAAEWAREHIGTTVRYRDRTCELVHVVGAQVAALRDAEGRLHFMAPETLRRQWLAENFASTEGES